METTQCLCLASRRAARSITRSFDRALKPHGIRATQFTLLAVLALKGPQSIGALAAILSADRTTLTRNLALAAEQSLVSMRAGSDSRSRIASITPAGRRRLARALSTWRETQAAMTRAMGFEAAEGLRRVSRAPSDRNMTMEQRP